jgi:NADPH2:quinone reductase
MWFGREDLPFVSRIDVSGVVRETGAGVDAVEPGDRVLLCPNETCSACRYCAEGPETLCAEFGLFHGGFAEAAAVPAHRLLPLADDVDLVEAAALPVSYMTAYHMLRRAGVEPGDLLFVPGATGGVGVAAIQLASIMGVETVGTSRSAKKLERISDLGATHTVHSDDPEEIEAAVEAIGEVDAVINHLGGPFTDVGLSLLRRGGRMLVCGRTTGGHSEIDIWDLFRRHKRVEGSTMGTQVDLQRIVDLFEAGTLSPVVGSVYDLADASRAFADMDERSVFGKSLLVP